MSTRKKLVTEPKERGANLLDGLQLISYQTLLQEAPGSDGTFCAYDVHMSVRKPKPGTICPINNLPPSRESAESGILNHRDLTLHSLQRDLIHKSLLLSEVLFKLSRALEIIASTEQFFSDGMHRGQWETYDQLMRRRARLKAVREMIMSAGTSNILDPKDEEELKRKIGLE